MEKKKKKSVQKPLPEAPCGKILLLPTKDLHKSRKIVQISLNKMQFSVVLSFRYKRGRELTASLALRTRSFSSSAAFASSRRTRAMLSLVRTCHLQDQENLHHNISKRKKKKHHKQISTICTIMQCCLNFLLQRSPQHTSFAYH